MATADIASTLVLLPALPPQETWLAGSAEASTAGTGECLIDPNTGEALVERLASSADQLDRAIAAAQRVHSKRTWLDLGVEGRSVHLLALADELDVAAEQIAALDALNSGVPITVSRLFAGSNGDAIRSAVARARAAGDSRRVAAEHGEVRIHRVPWGVTALIMPWNAPSAMAVKKLAYALVSGAPVVMKPSPVSPFSTELVVQAAHRMGIPAGVVNLVYGGAEIGSRLVADPRIRAISMTGSTPTGRAIAAATAPNLTRVRLELGSNNAAIVRGDADVADAAERITAGALKMSGQWCEAPRRVIASRRIIDELTEALRGEFGRWSVGSSLDESTQLGPVAFAGRKAELEAQRDALEHTGCRVIRVGDVPQTGSFFAPTIVMGENIDLNIEIFGPLLTVQPADDDEHAIALANAGHVGLAGYLFGRDEQAALALGVRLEAGEVKVNGTSVLDMSSDSAQSFFGHSGIGGHGDADVLDFFSGKRIVGTDLPGLPL